MSSLYGTGIGHYAFNKIYMTHSQKVRSGDGGVVCHQNTFFTSV